MESSERDSWLDYYPPSLRRKHDLEYPLPYQLSTGAEEESADIG
jgi:hypothetical protein